MRAIQVWRWAKLPGYRAPIKQSSLIRVPDDRIDQLHALLMSSWRVSGGLGLPAPQIVGQPDEAAEPPPLLPPGEKIRGECLTAQQLVEMGTCPDCDSRVLFEKLPQRFTYRCVTLHDETCPEFHKLQQQLGENPQ
jgi:hypothetical protein